MELPQLRNFAMSCATGVGKKASKLLNFLLFCCTPWLPQARCRPTLISSRSLSTSSLVRLRCVRPLILQQWQPPAQGVHFPPYLPRGHRAMLSAV